MMNEFSLKHLSRSICWLGSALLLTATMSLPAQVIFPAGSSWKFFIGTQEASTPVDAWRLPGFNDSTWTTGNAPVGYGETVTTTIPSSQAGGYMSVFFRKTFTVANPLDVSQLALNIRIDDGYVAWINGNYIGRYNVPDGTLAYNASASTAIEPTDTVLTVATNVSSLLVTGANVVALQVFNAAASSTDLYLDASLSLIQDTSAPMMDGASPPAGATVTELRQIEVFFNESVRGVDAGDLLINGLAVCTNVVTYSPGDYLFQFPSPPTGGVTVTWAAGHGITDLASSPHPFAGTDTWTYTYDPNAIITGVIISEFLADNGHGIEDEDGTRGDWIELYNAGSLAVNLNGWFLTDTTNILTKWQFPSVVINPNRYLLVWATEKDRTNPAAPLHTNFKLAKEGEFLGLVDARTNIVSAFAPVYPAQQTDISYGRDRVDPNLLGYFSTPTPGAQNTPGGAGFAPEPAFSLDSGVYTNASLSLTISAPSGTIRYTVDGTPPTSGSTAYSGPISITAGTTVKARVFQGGLLPSAVLSRTFILLDTTTRDFNSNLPLVIIDTSGRGVAQNVPPGQPRTKASVAVIDAFRGRATLRGKVDYLGPAEVEIFGQTSAGFPKQPFNIEIQDPYGNDEAVPLLGMPSEADWKMRNPYSDKCLMNDFLGYELFEKMGHYQVRRRFVEVFVDTGGGKLTYPGDYYGVLVFLEKIEVDKNRVNIAELTPSHTNEPAITGGYMIKKDKVSTGDLDFNVNGGAGFSAQALKMHEPKPAQITTAQFNWIKNYLNQFTASMYGANWLTATGTNHYSAYIDVDSFVDAHWIVEFTKQIDGYRLSNYMSKDRNGKLKMEPIWDWNLSFGNADYLDGQYTNGWYWALCGENDHIWLRRLMCGSTSPSGTTGDPDFNQKIADRWSVLRTNVMAGSNVVARIDELAAYLNEAQARDFAKFPRLGSYVWPNPPMYSTPTTYAGIIANMKSWVAGRYAWIDSQFMKAPLFTISEGPIAPGTLLAMTAPLGTIYYTLDGTDPRAPGGSLSPTAATYTGGVALSGNARVFARARNGNNWSGPTVATFYTQIPKLVVTELMYHPQPPPAGTTNIDEDFEYVELKNTGTSALNLLGYSLSGTVGFTFPALTLPAGQRVLVVRNAAAFEARYGTNLLVAGEYAGNLGNDGGRVVLEGRYREPILNFEYGDAWHPITDGFGFSLVVTNENSALNTWTNPAAWRPSTALNGTPGTNDAPRPAFPPIVINEALTHTDLPQMDTIELRNLAGTNVSIAGWFLTDDFREPKKYRIPDGLTVPANGYRTFNTNDFGVAASPNGLGGTNTPFSLSSLGDEAYLFAADSSGNLTGYYHGFGFEGALNGTTFGRHVLSTGQENFVTQVSPTLLSANSGPLVGPIVISEIMYHPADVLANGAWWNNTEDEYIELRNISGTAVNLFEATHRSNTWKLDKGVEFTFPTNTALPAGGYLLVVNFDPARNPTQLAAFRARFGVGAGVPVLGPYNGNLDNEEENVCLFQPDAPVLTGANAGEVPYVLVDKVHYRDTTPWPLGADGVGLSLHRKAAGDYGNDPANWTAAGPTPGAAYVAGPGPTFTLQPTNQSVMPATTVTLASLATGSGTIRYQWRFNGGNLAGATNSSLVLPNITPAQTGQYQVLAYNNSGATASSNATLTVRVAVTIVQQPSNMIVRDGTNVTLTVVATSSNPPLRYQWLFNGSPIAEAVNASLVITNVQDYHDGIYAVDISDNAGTVRSANAILKILVRPSVVAPVPPLQLTAMVGEPITIAVKTRGNLPMYYRLRHFYATGGGYVLTNQVLSTNLAFFTIRDVTSTNMSGDYYAIILTNEAYTAQNLAFTNWYINVLADTDGDRMPDSWETSHNFRADDPTDGTNDFDLDGMTNKDEYTAGTDPTDPSSYLKVEFAPSGSATVQFLAVSNRTYSIEYKDGMDSPMWTKLAEFIALSTNRIEQAVDPAPALRRFYRVVTPRSP